MLKISRLTDYGLLASVYLARKSREVVSAREIAHFYHLPLPAVSKVLKRLHEGGAIQSHRGVGGGYSFDLVSEEVTLGFLLEILEGKWELTECETYEDDGSAVCSIRTCCPSRNFMFGINRAIKSAFEQVTLADLERGAVPAPLFDLKRGAGHEASSSRER